MASEANERDFDGVASGRTTALALAQLAVRVLRVMCYAFILVVQLLPHRKEGLVIFQVTSSSHPPLDLLPFTRSHSTSLYALDGHLCSRQRIADSRSLGVERPAPRPSLSSRCRLR